MLSTALMERQLLACLGSGWHRVQAPAARHAVICLDCLSASGSSCVARHLVLLYLASLAESRLSHLNCGPVLPQLAHPAEPRVTHLARDPVLPQLADLQGVQD